jgi:carboxymethylenebutenolidase
MVDFAANGRTISGYRADPSGASAKAVVVIQEWWGLNDHIKEVADRLAAKGFVALAPDLYHGTLARSPDEAGKLLMALNIEEAEQDLRGALRHLRALTGGPAGTVGFCMGGALSLFAACTSPEEVGACVIFYGGHPKVGYDFDRLRAPVLGHWAEDDTFANPVRDRCEQELGRRGKPFTFHTYPGTRHAFFNDTRGEVYVKDAAALSFARTVEFFEQNLGARGASSHRALP